MLARASWASTLGSRCPAIIAWSMWRPDTPKMSLATDDSLIWASSRSLLHALLLPGPLPDERASVPGQVTQPADRGWRHEARPAHAPLDHLGQPHRIQLVGLGAAGDVLDVPGVEQPAGESFGFQQVERRLPVVAGGFHRDQRHPSSVQPGGQVQQRPGGPSVLPDFLAAVSRLVVVRHSDTHRQAALPMSRAQTRSTRSTASSVSSMSITSTSSWSQAERLPGEPTGRNAGGLACSKQPCRALAAAPTVRLLSGLNWHQASTTSTGNQPDFHPGTGRPAGTQTTAMCCYVLSSRS